MACPVARRSPSRARPTRIRVTRALADPRLGDPRHAGNTESHWGSPLEVPQQRRPDPLPGTPRRGEADPLSAGPRRGEADAPRRDDSDLLATGLNRADADLLATGPRRGDADLGSGSPRRGDADQADSRASRGGSTGNRGRGGAIRHDPGEASRHGHDLRDGAEPLGRDPLRTPSAPPTSTRVTPPWLADDLPAEPAMLRLVEPAPLADPALRDDPLASAGPSRRASREPDPLSGDRGGDRGRGAPSLRLIGGSAPVEDESDGDLLIFSQIQSAWFTDMEDLDTTPAWDDNPADAGWQAAERASSPVLGDDTTVGLPRRVPQANLVPGSALPPADERGLRVVRDPAAMAAHTTGYFRGSRRGEEVRGFSIGGRPGRESAGNWDFARDSFDSDQDGPYEYRSAARR